MLICFTFLRVRVAKAQMLLIVLTIEKYQIFAFISIFSFSTLFSSVSDACLSIHFPFIISMLSSMQLYFESIFRFASMCVELEFWCGFELNLNQNAPYSCTKYSNITLQQINWNGCFSDEHFNDYSTRECKHKIPHL